MPSAADERADIVHDLADLLTAASADCLVLGEEILILKGGGPSLSTLARLASSVNRAVALFPHLRRVM